MINVLVAISLCGHASSKGALFVSCAEKHLENELLLHRHYLLLLLIFDIEIVAVLTWHFCATHTRTYMRFIVQTE